MTGVEREPLTITLPHGATETTMWLVSAYCEPHATRATEQEARQLCETAERANLETGAEFVWHPTDDTELTHELYVVLGDEFRTEYTVTPIHLRQEQPPPAPADDGDRLTPTLMADVTALLTRHGYRMPTDTAAQQRALTETFAVLGFLGKAFEGHPPADPATAQWNKAIDWLLNSRHTADEDIQAALWALADGRCTVEEANRGYLADYTPLTDLPEAAE
ncbi:hypothetical protein [Streptosporangium sp. NPDC004631]